MHVSEGASSKLSGGVPHRSPEHEGKNVERLTLVCPQCGTTLIATADQVGQEIVCGECLEGVPVVMGEPPADPPPGEIAGVVGPDSEPGNVPPTNMSQLLDDELLPPLDLPLAATKPEMEAAAPLEVPKTPMGAASETLSPASDRRAVEDDGDDLVLAPPEELGSPVPDIMDSIKAAEARSDAKFGESTSHTASADQGAAPAASGSEFGFSCKVCETRLYARPNQIGQALECPDCFVENIVPQPVAAPSKPNVGRAADDFGLEEAVVPSFPGATAQEPQRLTPHENARRLLAEAEAELSSELEEEAEFDSEPPMTLMVSFLVDPSAMLIALFCGVSFGLWLCCFVRAFSAETMTRLLGIMGTLATSVLGLLAAAVLLSACLAIVTETSAGNRKVTGWPGLDVGEWLFSVLALLNPLWISGLPGVVLGAMLSLKAGGGGFVLVFLSWLALFPIVMHGANENQSSFMPFSFETVRSIQKHPKQWGMFYVSTFFLMLFCSVIFCGLVVTSAWGGAWVTNTCGGVLLVTVMMIYFRVFGWHIWRLNELDSGGYLQRVAGEGLYEEVE